MLSSPCHFSAASSSLAARSLSPEFSCTYKHVATYVIMLARINSSTATLLRMADKMRPAESACLPLWGFNRRADFLAMSCGAYWVADARSYKRRDPQ